MWVPLMCCILVFAVSFAKDVDNLPTVREILHKCRSSPTKEDISQCIIIGLEGIRDVLVYGDHDVNFTPLEVIDVDDLIFHEGSGQVKLEAVFTNVKLHGISEFKFKELSIDYDNKNISMVFYFPQMKLTNHYKLSGNVIILPIVGEGTNWITMDNVLVTIRSDIAVENGKLVFHYTYFDYNPERAVLRLNNLFDNSPVLGEAMNTFINENSLDIMDDMKPDSNPQFSKVFERITNKIFQNLLLDEIPGFEHFVQN